MRWCGVKGVQWQVIVLFMVIFNAAAIRILAAAAAGTRAVLRQLRRRACSCL